MKKKMRKCEEILYQIIILIESNIEQKNNRLMEEKKFQRLSNAISISFLIAIQTISEFELNN